ncbi:MAG: homocysteine biosynthesis protein [bacterium]
MKKTIAEINKKIRQKKAVVLTAEEMIDFVRVKGVKKAAQTVDVVTTGTFGPMCSSGIYFNIPVTKPKIKLGGGEVTLNKVPAYAAYAARDVFLGATALPRHEKNKKRPIHFTYGGANVIEDFVSGRKVLLEAAAYGTDCYPSTGLKIKITLRDLNDAVFFSPRNCYQNYNVAVNLSDKPIYTYMGILKPKMGNASYSSAGELSPLLNDPELKTIGIGTKIFLGGGTGFVAWHGTQHATKVKRKNGIPKEPAATLALIGDLKKMSPEFLRAASLTGYGITLSVGIGVPIPVTDEKIAYYTSRQDSDIFAPVIDYSHDYPYGRKKILAEVSYASLRSGKIKIGKKEVATFPWSSYAMARKISFILKKHIESGRFLLGEPVQKLPGAL